MDSNVKHELGSRDPLRKGQTISTIDAAIAGSLSGLLARTVTAPLDTLKIRYQLQPMGEHKYTNIFRTFKTIAAEEGLLGFWKGNVPASMLYVLYGSVQFASYAYFNNLFNIYFKSISPKFQSVAVGALAGVTSSMVTYPLDVLRTRFIANRSAKRFHLLSSIRSIYSREGVSGFFHGYKCSMFTVGMSAGIIFGTYETLNIYAEKSNMYWLASCSSGITAIVSKTITFPLDTVRRRLQIIDAKELSQFTAHASTYRSYIGSSFLSVACQICSQEGILTLYRGLPLALFKSTPATIISLWGYGKLITLL